MSEARKSCRDGRHTETHTFERGVSPRLVVGWEHCGIHAYQQIVISSVEYSVGAVEIAWHIDYVDLVALFVGESYLAYAADNRVGIGIVESMGKLRLGKAGLALGRECVLQIGTRVATPCGHHYKRHYRTCWGKVA